MANVVRYRFTVLRSPYFSTLGASLIDAILLSTSTKLLNVFLYLDQPSSAILLGSDRKFENISIMSLSLSHGATREDLYSYFLQRARPTVNKTVCLGLAIFDPGEWSSSPSRWKQCSTSFLTEKSRARGSRGTGGREKDKAPALTRAMLREVRRRALLTFNSVSLPSSRKFSLPRSVEVLTPTRLPPKRTILIRYV